jgi:predicted DNA-binding transcriptional regulator YafY
LLQSKLLRHHPKVNYSLLCTEGLCGAEKSRLLKDKIINAIRNKKLLEFEYDGQAIVVEPHVYGLSSLDSRPLLVGYQVSGGNEGWREYDESKISDPKVSDQTFKEVREGYKPNDARFNLKFAKV